MDAIDDPDDLKAAMWDKKKGALPPASGVAIQLCALQRKREAVDSAALKPDWTTTLPEFTVTLRQSRTLGSTAWPFALRISQRARE